MPEEFVIKGTALRPRSEEVWTRIVCSDFERVEERVELNDWRSRHQAALKMSGKGNRGIASYLLQSWAVELRH